MPTQRVRVEEAPRWVMVFIPRSRQLELQRRAREQVVSADEVATRLLLWALEHAPEPLE